MDRHQRIESMIDRIDFLRQCADDAIKLEDIFAVFDCVGGVQDGDIEWLGSKYQITVWLSEEAKAKLRIVTPVPSAGKEIVTRPCACGCGRQVTGNAKRRFYSAACKQRVYREKG